ncbi:MAG: RAMP superfamily CRISPR-associated protein, partial [Anaerolineae bacterium]
MLIRGKLIAETPIYRGNARKTLFTRDRDGTQRLVSLAGEISGTAQALMDAFVGESRDGRNIGLLNRAWRRLYGEALPEGLIKQVDCRLEEEVYPQDRFFDLRMGLRLDEDRWAAEANANYKMETVFRDAAFDFSMMVNDAVLERGDNRARLYYLLEEMREGRFWFGGGKSKGLGRLRLEAELPGPAPAAPTVQGDANHLKIVLRFNAENPVLVGWNWGKVDPEQPAFAAIEGRLLIAAMRDIPDPVRQRLELVIGGPILSPEDWKRKLADYLPRALGLWLKERSSTTTEVWILSEAALAKLTKGKYPLSQKIADAVKPLCGQPFPSQAAAEAALKERAGNQARRIMEVMERQQQASQQLDPSAWGEVVAGLGLDEGLAATLAAQLGDEAALTQTLAEACRPLLPRLYQQVDQQVDLLRSDAWVDNEIATRETHLKIKVMLLEGKISEAQWMNRNQPPEGISPADWRAFLEEHSRVRYQHIVHPANLRKSITNDRNFIAFLKSYRAKVRQELSQPYHVDFRSGGPFNRDVARKYGKPYDTMFMRMLTWSKSDREGAWEIYIPGSTIKGAFRKRASQVLKTLWGESARTAEVLDYLFGKQGQRGAIYFSDAYLTDPTQPEERWCSMDGVRMDPATARPIETAKHDYLFAYGDQLNFRLQIELQDLTERDLPALAVLLRLLEDFQRGDIVLGGEKTSGFGWVKGRIGEISWLTADPNSKLTARLFGDRPLTRVGLWHRLTLQGEEAATGLAWSATLDATMQVGERPPLAQAGFVSHRSFGGYAGTLA